MIKMLSAKKIEENESCKKTLALHIRFCSFLFHIAYKEATELARKGPTFSNVSMRYKVIRQN